MIRAVSSPWAAAAARWTAVVLLLAASAAKVVQVITEPDPHLGTMPVPAWALAALVAGELSLCWWLIHGAARRSSQRLAAGVFGLFACWTAAQSWAGNVSCGCFGPVPVPPPIMLGVDLIVGLALWQASRVSPPGREQRVWSVLVGVMAIGAMGLVVLLGVRPAVLAHITPAAVAGSEPTRARGQPPGWRYLPGMMTGLVDPRVSVGRWRILCYRYSCPHCQAHLDAWVAQARAAESRGEHVGFLWLDAPGQAPDLLTPDMAGDLPRWQRTMPMMRTPALLLVENGVITAVDDPASMGPHPVRTHP